MPTVAASMATGVASIALGLASFGGCSLAADAPPEVRMDGAEEEQPTGRKGSFLVLGDWGFDWDTHGDITNVSCQQTIANRMAEVMEELGDVKFVINVGDSFYPGGAGSKHDDQWQTKWRDIYSPELRSVPWYSVYGNHDIRTDPCSCTTDVQACAQVNADIKNLSFFYMPSPSWFLPHPELDLEVIGLDLNKYQNGWQEDVHSSQDLWASDCQKTPCHDQCISIMEARSEEALELFSRRLNESEAKNLLVFSHYPSDYFPRVKPDFIRALSDDSKHHIEYFGGHRHNVDQILTVSTYPNNNWLVGGGGGWGCEILTAETPQNQGFVVGEIAANGNIHTYSVLVDAEACCK